MNLTKPRPRYRFVSETTLECHFRAIYYVTTVFTSHPVLCDEDIQIHSGGDGGSGGDVGSTCTGSGLHGSLTITKIHGNGQSRRRAYTMSPSGLLVIISKRSVVPIETKLALRFPQEHRN
uniref:Uncharacterized protein n=1 Tax=Vespula pensylvanica TaxID=30213 RepID=A0A834NS72_VESPE|nr:hypothetical protein H0235_011542 [Vespula pensylvanica]